ncbi:MAG: thioredoxin family protein [Bacteroidales bacterium]|nr:thioredoxin family protein [Bacteroidales bacterium]
MKKIFIILFAWSYSFVIAQDINVRKFDEKSNQDILIGKCTKQVFMQQPFQSWFKTAYEQYSPDNSVLEQAQKIISDKIKIIVIFGSWCSDTQEQLPRFFKVMDFVGYTPDMIELIAVDRNKQAESFDLGKYGIERIPTFIFYKNGKEKGRIVETPTISMEKDILEILKK